MEHCVDDIISQMGNVSACDEQLVRDAWQFAEAAHAHHTRSSGHPYMSHPAAVAYQLAQCGLGSTTVAAALLHDIIEDTDISTTEIESTFGSDVLFLVESVTKLSKLHYSRQTRRIESLRKLFAAMAQDLRVLLIKLADRHHNMETLHHLSDERQQHIARETLDIYAPLAYRLGIRAMSRPLENLAFAYLEPSRYETVQSKRQSVTDIMEPHVDTVNTQLHNALRESDIDLIRTEKRTKGLYSLDRKMQRKEYGIDEVYDVYALRVIVSDIPSCYRTMGIAHEYWTHVPYRIKDYISSPKANGYQSLHTTIFCGHGTMFELHIRTEHMDRFAKYGAATPLIFDDERYPAETNSSIQWLNLFSKSKSNERQKESSEHAAAPPWLQQLVRDQRENDVSEFIANLRSDFFESRIFLFTPQGDIIDLPVGATVIDFAYAVHTNVGDHLERSWVNGTETSLTHELNNGDIVSVEAGEDPTPHHEWLAAAKTCLARKRIRALLGNKNSSASQEDTTAGTAST
jgi:GTP pyrophosphokinase